MVAEPTLLTTEHDPMACMGSLNHCYWHNVDEPGEPFKVCFECRHGFMTPAELLAGHNEHLAEFGQPPETDPQQVFCCPMCTHDF